MLHQPWYFVNSWQTVGFPFTGNSLSSGFLTFVSKFRVIGSELLAEASTKVNWDSSFREKRSTCPDLCIPHSDRGCRACLEHRGMSHLGGGTKGKQARRTDQWMCSCLFPFTVSGKTCDYICLPALYLSPPRPTVILAERGVINKAQEELKALNGGWKRAGR